MSPGTVLRVEPLRMPTGGRLPLGPLPVLFGNRRDTGRVLRLPTAAPALGGTMEVNVQLNLVARRATFGQEVLVEEPHQVHLSQLTSPRSIRDVQGTATTITNIIKRGFIREDNHLELTVD